MNNQRFNPTHQNLPQGQQEEWERKLEQLRRQNSGQPLSGGARQVSSAIRPQPAMKNLAQTEARERALQEYLREWQEEINAEFSAEQPVEDAAVLLQEDWIAAQAALQGDAEESAIESTHTVWLNPKRQIRGEQTIEQKEFFDKDTPPISAENIPVSINVINPQVAPKQPVTCLSEKELLERLTAKLLPHLTDAVSGMIRTAVQKQTAVLTYQIQETLAKETPGLVKEVLDHNLASVMKDIRYDLKYKR
ncbi:hypothetical protein [Neisseria sp. 83E34]|uniref:hypothetical protein n=1 Tax=Neisseria sp. 83E34 TaxID=1692264 RepID=UPI0006CE6469|nr:hypothetical protein [Neisseria sp. 83E34]KPN71027.1 hypothetical protein AKG09_09090 [Neisseria sp. 83E34]